MRHHHTGSRPHVQGSAQPLRVRHSARNLTDGGGLVLVRKLFDRLGLGGWIDCRTGKEKGFFRPSLMVEVWVVLLLYGGGVMDDLPLLERRGVRRIFGWVRVPHPTTFGRWLRRVAERMVPLLDTLLWYMVRRRWALSGGTPKRLTLVVDSTVVVRYGRRQAGAEVGYNPKKRGRPSHHPLLAFVRETGDCLGVRWRGGSAHTAEGAEEWIGDLVGRLRAAGVEDITVRLDKGFFARRMVRTLEGLGVSFLLKVPRHRWLSRHRGPWRYSARGEAVFPGRDVWTACAFRRFRSPVPPISIADSRGFGSVIPEDSDHLGEAEVGSGAGGSGYGVESRGWKGFRRVPGLLSGGRGTGRGRFFGRGGGRAKGFGRPPRRSGRPIWLAHGAVWPGLRGFGRIRAGRNGRPDGHTARSEPSFRSIAPDRGERGACGRMRRPGPSADQASPGSARTSFVES